MAKYLAYIPDGELFEAKYAFLQFAGVSSDEANLVVLETEAEIADLEAALVKTGKDFLLIEIPEGQNIRWRGNADLAAVVGTLTS